MVAKNYDDSLRRLLVHEGGYINHPSDPGGPTNFGITIYDYRKYIKAGATADDVRAMSIADAKRIYRARYWDAMRCDDLLGGVDYAIFDYGVNSGTGRAPKVLQRLLGVAADGEIGPVTLEVMRSRDPKVLVAAICNERLKFLQALKTWPVFGKGWGRRVAEVRAAALVMAGAEQQVIVAPSIVPSPGGELPWMARLEALMGLYEFSGGNDNAAILAMAKACGGKIAKTYVHDSIPWCALNENYILVSAGLPGNDSLWALDFRNYGVKLNAPAVGAIATKHRQPSGGHVFNVVGRTRDGRLVGRGGNQSDMVCDEVFNPGECQYNWPANYPLPRTGFDQLPVVAPLPKARREFAGLPLLPTRTAEGKAVVPVPSVLKPLVTTSGGSGGGALAVDQATSGGLGLTDWIVAHPWQTAGLVVAGGVIVAAGATYAARRWQRWRQAAATPGLIPVAA